MAANIIFPNVCLQDLIAEPILETEYMDPGYSGHATDVWRVKTAKRTVALRIFKAESWGGPFWDGMRSLFHMRYRFRAKVSARNRFLRETGGLPVPKVLAHGEHNRLEYLVMEWMAGQRMESFAELSPAGLRAFGRHLAALHAHPFPKSGTLNGDKGWPPRLFRAEILSTLNMLFANYYKDQPTFARIHAGMIEKARQLPLGEAFAPVLVDMGASQYLRSEQGEVCALVDTDAYAIGPRELDFILLEYGLTPAMAKEFALGYQEVLELPDLREVRPVYRYLYRLMEVEGDGPLQEWMGQKELFR